MSAYEQAARLAEARVRKEAIKLHNTKRTIKIIGNGLWVGAIVAFQLMFALALFGHPQFGFLELWLAADAIATLISAGVASGLNTFAYVDTQAAD